MENFYGDKINKFSFSQVHIRVASPPLKHPCYMGINIPTKDELIANKMSVEKLAEHLGIFSRAASHLYRLLCCGHLQNFVGIPKLKCVLGHSEQPNFFFFFFNNFLPRSMLATTYLSARLYLSIHPSLQLAI